MGSRTLPLQGILRHDREFRRPLSTVTGERPRGRGTDLVVRVTEMVVDLRSVQFLGAAGLGVLVDTRNACAGDGIALRVVADPWRSPDWTASWTSGHR